MLRPVGVLIECGVCNGSGLVPCCRCYQTSPALLRSHSHICDSCDGQGRRAVHALLMTQAPAVNPEDLN